MYHYSYIISCYLNMSEDISIHSQLACLNDKGPFCCKGHLMLLRHLVRRKFLAIKQTNQKNKLPHGHKLPNKLTSKYLQINRNALSKPPFCPHIQTPAVLLRLQRSPGSAQPTKRTGTVQNQPPKPRKKHQEWREKTWLCKRSFYHPPLAYQTTEKKKKHQHVELKCVYMLHVTWSLNYSIGI